MFPTRQDATVHKAAATRLRKKQANLDVERRSIRTPSLVVDAILQAATKEYRSGHSSIEFELKLQISNFIEWAEAHNVFDGIKRTAHNEMLRCYLRRVVQDKLRQELSPGTSADLTCRRAMGGTYVFGIRIWVISHP